MLSDVPYMNIVCNFADRPPTLQTRHSPFNKQGRNIFIMKDYMKANQMLFISSALVSCIVLLV